MKMKNYKRREQRKEKLCKKLVGRSFAKIFPMVGSVSVRGGKGGVQVINGFEKDCYTI